MFGSMQIFGKDDIFTNTWTTNSNGSIHNTTYGNVGIGTFDTATYELNVNGDTNITS
jgi:hypothetical protein